MSVFVGSEIFSGCIRAARNPRGMRQVFIDHFLKNWFILRLSILMCSEEFLVIIFLRVNGFCHSDVCELKKTN